MSERGTLGWIRGEVERSMAQARAGLGRLQTDGVRPGSIRACTAHLHQVTGALQIVGQEGAARFCEEIELLLSGFENHRPAMSDASVQLARRCMDALIQFVDGCAYGRAVSPLHLDPLLQEMQAARGVTTAGPSELFFPDLSIEPPELQDAREVAAGAVPVLVAAERARFQRGLLAWMRGDDAGLKVMRDALASIDATGLAPRDRTLWWVATAMLDGLLGGALDANAEVKKLCARIDQQMKHFAQGRTFVAERILRDVLYQVARARPVHPQVMAVQARYDLLALLPAADGDGLGLLEAEERARLGDQARACLQRAKLSWLSYTSGDGAALDAFISHVTDMRATAGTLLNLPLMRLGDAIEQTARALPREEEERPDVLIAEMASALLVAESALEFAEQPGDDLDGQVELISQRLRRASGGRSGDVGLPPVALLDQLDPRSGRRLPLGDVVREIRHNLMHIEQVLDGFFRDAKRRPSLSELSAPLQQVRGAFQLLDLDEASDLMRRCEQLILKIAGEEQVPSDGDVDLVANGLSSLDLFVQDLEHHSLDRERLVHDALSRFGSREEPPPASVRHRDAPVKTLEVEIRLALGRIARLGRNWERQRDDAALTRELVAEIESLARDAEVVGDASLAAATTRALASLRRGAAPDAGRALRALGEGEGSPATPRPSPEAARLVHAGQEVVERELFQVYLHEARDVLALIAGAIDACRRGKESRGALLTIRRCFHTLKGSGRMVGLEDLAEAALRVEVVLNHWLQDDLLVSGPLVEFLTDARDSFVDWIASLERGASIQVDGGRLAARGAALIEAALSAGDDAAVRAEAEAARPGTSEGARGLSKDLFEIFVQEAQEHLAVLGQALSDGTIGTPHALRAAHTLAGISRTAGVSRIAAVATALEQWSMAIGSDPARLAPGMAAAQRAVDFLVAAVAHASDGEPSSDPDTVIRELQAVTPHTSAERRPEAGLEGRDELRDDLDHGLLPLFLEEAEDLMSVIGEELRESRKAPDGERTVQALQRTLHTLKGSARLVGAMRFGDEVHRMEARVTQAAVEREFSPSLVDELEERLDAMRQHLHRFVAPREVTSEPGGQALPAAMQPGRQVPAMRVGADVLDGMVSRASEVSIARSQVESGVQSVREYMAELTDTVTRLRAQLREMEILSEISTPAQLRAVPENDSGFDPLEFDRYSRLQELVRLMAESTADVVTVQGGLRRTLDEATLALRNQARSGRELQDNLMSVRTVAFSTVIDRLYRVLRQACRELGKKTRLEVVGQQVEMDRGVLEKLVPALEHLLRNAVVHGVEPSELRRERGKDETGQVTIELRQEASEVVIDVRDDGNGIDYPAVRRRALENDLATPEQAEDEGHLRRLIFGAGFTTSREVTGLAGRGVGLDAVRSEVQGLGGWVQLDTREGEGSRFRVHLPLTLVVVQALLVRTGDRIHAFPTHLVEHVQRVDASTITRAHEDGHLSWADRRYAFHYLGHLLNEPMDPPCERRNAVVLVHAGDERLALQVDAVLRNHEAVLRNLGPQIASIPGLIGVTILPEGEIAPILNPFFLAQYQSPSLTAGQRLPAPREAEVDPRPLVMVVDDSLTVRRLLEGLLLRNGYRVVTARDGAEAEHLLGEHKPRVMLVDIEMPRMDGFELTRLVRANKATAHIPIVIITSRSADKHRAHALKLGADVFLGKPFVEGEILRIVGGLADRRARVRA